MRDILNLGSLNIDHVYQVDHIVAPGETIASNELSAYAGGKGLNQSVALARAGAKVVHGGAVGPDGAMLVKLLADNGIDSSRILKTETPTGHAVIQVTAKGQNSIVLHKGANHRLTQGYIDVLLESRAAGTLVLLQNETNLVPYAVSKAKSCGLRVAFNPSPFNNEVLACSLESVDVLLLNEIEAEQITRYRDSGAVLDCLQSKYPDMMVVLTLGKRGAVLRHRDIEVTQPIYDIPVVDTTAAGDTFTGFLLACLEAGMGYRKAMQTATKASALAVSRHGASPSIPTLREVEVLENQGW